MNEFQAGLYAKVRAQVPAADLEVLDNMRPTDWIAASHSRPVILDGIIRELGPRATELWVSLVGTRLLRTPLLGGFFDMLVRLGGMTPSRFLKSLPRGWGKAYRDWGEPEVTELGERKPSSISSVWRRICSSTVNTGSPSRVRCSGSSTWGMKRARPC